MRPIDADTVLESVRAQIELVKQLFGEDEDIINISDIIGTTFEKQLDLAPTLDVIPVKRLRMWFVLNILPKYDDYIHTKTYPHNEAMEDIYSKGHEEGWDACLKAIKEELDYWEKENATGSKSES